MKKIVVEKEEGIAEVVDRVMAESDGEVTLVVPKGSVLARSVKNFHLLKREADAAGKSVAVESVDDAILAFAKESELEASHPLWRGVEGGGGVSDIIPANRGALLSEERPAPKRRKKKVEPVKLTVPQEEAAATMASEAKPEEELAEEGPTPGFDVEEGMFQKKSPLTLAREWGKSALLPERRPSKKLLWILGGALALILVVFAVVTWSFGRVTIVIDFKKTPWDYEGKFLADKSVSKVNAANKVIPAQIFSTQKNTTQSFPASGSANVSLKAQGTITIYNGYSSAKQELVATTRFVTPDGKLFRLVAGVTVPGATVTDGKIVPSSIDAAVIADQAGPSYNVGPAPKLVIPGFQGTPKYSAFYGELKTGTSGGFAGKRAVPTTKDISDAKAKVTSALRGSLTNNLTTSYPNNFKILDGATTVTVTKLTVTTSTDEQGNFSVFGEAALQAVGFDEAQFKDFLLSLAQTQKPNSVFKALSLDYKNAQPDFAKGKVAFTVSAAGSLKPVFSVSDFRAGILGKGLSSARTAISLLPDLADGKLSVWPRWLSQIPSNPAKVEITAN